MKIKLNKEKLRDKIYACWIGKNIGGTMGTPYEGKTSLLDIKGFSSPVGEPLPNDDLDLQLVWLAAMEQAGPHRISPALLSEYWLSFIPPHWNEYGIGKSNVKAGLLPPISGEMYNEGWKNSNGAWIRSEIWACMAPGFPSIATKYAAMDAQVDHGISEGTYAEIFTAAMQSIAFTKTDIRTVIGEALEYIPKNCRVARSINIVLREYDKKTDWKEVREMIVRDSEDLGWFQAPANVAFTVLGLIYGEGDFKKSLIYAIDCGDDTDCTGATCGATLGIMKGTRGIPDDWRDYIGDRIITMAVDRAMWDLPSSCKELTDRVTELIPSVFKANNVYMEYTDGEDEGSEKEYMQTKTYKDIRDEMNEFILRTPYSFEIRQNNHTAVIVEYEDKPEISPLCEFNVKLTLKNYQQDPHAFYFEVFLPEGWSAEYRKTAHCSHVTGNTSGQCIWKMKIKAGENVAARNNIYIVISSQNHALPIFVPITLLG